MVAFEKPGQSFNSEHCNLCTGDTILESVNNVSISKNVLLCCYTMLSALTPLIGYLESDTGTFLTAVCLCLSLPYWAIISIDCVEF